jgi:mannose-6-phosphate isomerase-like protein (cupin superfamily)
MSRRTGRGTTVAGILAALIVIPVAAWLPAVAADPQPKPLKSGVVSFEDAKAHQADWGEMRRYFTEETSGTKDVLTAVAIVKPGKAVPRAHRHAEEEYLILAEGSGTWSLDGKEFPAKRGDILYAEPKLHSDVEVRRAHAG